MRARVYFCSPPCTHCEFGNRPVRKDRAGSPEGPVLPMADQHVTVQDTATSTTAVIARADRRHDHRYRPQARGFIYRGRHARPHRLSTQFRLSPATRRGIGLLRPPTLPHRPAPSACHKPPHAKRRAAPTTSPPTRAVMSQKHTHTAGQSSPLPPSPPSSPLRPTPCPSPSSVLAPTHPAAPHPPPHLAPQLRHSRRLPGPLAPGPLPREAAAQPPLSPSPLPPLGP